MRTVTFNIPDDLHKSFKHFCVSKSVSMKDVLILAIQRLVIGKESKELRKK